jgi:hypothetical protein
MRVKFEYGRQGLHAELPDERIVRTLAYKDAPPLADPQAELARLLANPIGTPPLAELARGRKDACIVICDITRPVPNELILRGVLQTLEAAGIPRAKITILVATGLHRPDLDRQPLCGRRPEDHDGPDRAAPHGGLFRRAEADLPRDRGPGDGEVLART